MKKWIIRIFLCLSVSVLCWGVFLLRDRSVLRNSIVRLHVVANSDTAKDQAVKLAVRDAILDSIQADLEKIASKEEAVRYLEKAIPKLQQTANHVLQAAGCAERTAVTLCQEQFPVRHYDTFSLPSGVYDTLRVVIGSGEGENWWCVTFPNLCIQAAGDGFHSAAVGAGFSNSLINVLNNPDGYCIRFYLLDVLGKMENYLFEANDCPFS